MIDRSKFEWSTGDTTSEKDARRIYNALCVLTDKKQADHFDVNVILHNAGYTDQGDSVEEERVLDMFVDSGLATRVSIVCPPSESYTEFTRFGYRAI